MRVMPRWRRRTGVGGRGVIAGSATAQAAILERRPRDVIAPAGPLEGGVALQMSRISCLNSSTSSKLRYTLAKRT